MSSVPTLDCVSWFASRVGSVPTFVNAECPLKSRRQLRALHSLVGSRLPADAVGDVGTPERIAALVSYLISKDAQCYVTGEDQKKSFHTFDLVQSSALRTKCQFYRVGGIHWFKLLCRSSPMGIEFVTKPKEGIKNFTNTSGLLRGNMIRSESPGIPYHWMVLWCPCWLRAQTIKVEPPKTD
jgi:hypothetical protein